MNQIYLTFGQPSLCNGTSQAGIEPATHSLGGCCSIP